MQTDTTQKPHTLIASDRVEGTPVRRSDGEKIGTIERLMIDKLSGNVAYAVLSFGGFLGMGQKHTPVPWARLTYDRALGPIASISARTSCGARRRFPPARSSIGVTAAAKSRSTITIACRLIGAPIRA